MITWRMVVLRGFFLRRFSLHRFSHFSLQVQDASGHDQRCVVQSTDGGMHIAGHVDRHRSHTLPKLFGDETR